MRVVSPSSARPGVRWGVGLVFLCAVSTGATKALAAQGQPAPRTGELAWRFRPAAHADLWFHALAVIGADQPGPLGLYSADYAQRIREVKRELGIYPTALDSLAPELRQAFLDDEALGVLHFAPLFMPRAEPEGMLNALLAVAERKYDDRKLVGPGVAQGVRRIAFDVQKGGSRRTLKALVEATRREWELFYRVYWDSLHAREAPRYEAIQAVWDSVIVPPLTRYLTARRLIAGTVMPSPGLGPEGRIVADDPLAVGTAQNRAAVMMPVFTEAPEPSAFALLKELCFPIVDEAVRGLAADTARFGGRWAFDDMRRRAAVRCGALLLDFYAPTLAAKYRRAFLSAVGATESFTVSAFERVYALDADVFERIREEIRRGR